MNVPVSTSALPPVSSCGRTSSGRMLYFAGPKNVDWRPIKKSTTSSSGRFSSQNPAAAPSISTISTALTQRIKVALLTLSASCPAHAEKRKKGKMKIPAASATTDSERSPSSVIDL